MKCPFIHWHNPIFYKGDYLKNKKKIKKNNLIGGFSVRRFTGSLQYNSCKYSQNNILYKMP